MFSLIFPRQSLIIRNLNDDSPLINLTQKMALAIIHLQKMIPLHFILCKLETIKRNRLNYPFDVFDFLIITINLIHNSY